MREKYMTRTNGGPPTAPTRNASPPTVRMIIKKGSHRSREVKPQRTPLHHLRRGPIPQLSAQPPRHTHRPKCLPPPFVTALEWAPYPRRPRTRSTCSAPASPRKLIVRRRTFRSRTRYASHVAGRKRREVSFAVWATLPQIRQIQRSSVQSQTLQREASPLPNGGLAGS